MNYEKVLKKLTEEQQASALTSLKTPQERTEFEFGKCCGIVQGYQKAIDLIINTLKDEEKDDSNL